MAFHSFGEASAVGRFLAHLIAGPIEKLDAQRRGRVLFGGDGVFDGPAHHKQRARVAFALHARREPQLLKHGRRSTEAGRRGRGQLPVDDSSARHDIAPAAPININAARQHGIQFDLVTGNAS